MVNGDCKTIREAAEKVGFELKAGYVIDLRDDDPTDTMRIVSSTKPAAIDHDDQDD